MIFGAYFFLSEDKVERFKILTNITEVIAIIEGVAALLFMVIKIIPSYINEKQMEAKTIRNCYYDVDDSKDMKSNTLPAKPMKFTIWDKISTFKRSFFRKCFRCCYSEKQMRNLFTGNQITYLRAYDVYRKELNLFQVLQTVHKLKACVQAILNEDSHKLLNAKSIYFHHANIHKNAR
jgi:hypothetical protein